MNISGLRLVLVCLAGLSTFTALSNTPISTSHSGLDAMNDQIKAGIDSVVSIVAPRLDPSVQSYLRVYIERNRAKTENMIGRSAMYFPMFEAELEASGLPEDLKYLSVVESALVPHAISRVGATGLWQFMKPTAREFGLEITKYVDERCDPLMSTRAAIRYLDFLYKQFDSWELAMAAYNAGPGRVRYAIRKSGSKDYWTMQGHLPKETRSYVPGFIAASYVLNYYQDHGLTPAFPGEDLLITETVAVFRSLSFADIAKITGLPQQVVSALNPKYIRDYIPACEDGHALVLPATAAETMRLFLNSDGDVPEMALQPVVEIETGVEMEYVNKMVEHIYVVKSGDNLYSLAKKNQCSVEELQKWNRLSGTMLRIGQRLKIHKMERVLVKVERPVTLIAAPAARAKINVAPLTGMTMQADTKSDLSCLAKKCTTPVAASKVKPDFSSSVIVLRRRMCVRDMGCPSPKDCGQLRPGQRLN